MLKIKIIIIKSLLGLSYNLKKLQNISVLHKEMARIVFHFMRVLTGMEPYQAINHKNYCNYQKTLYLNINQDRTGYTSNVITNNDRMAQQLIPVKMNDLIVTQHRNVYIQGGSGLVLDISQKLAINDYCAEMDDRISYQDTLTISTKNKVLLLRIGRRNSYRKLKEGIMINDRYASNYYHGLNEVLIRLLVLEEVNHNLPSEIPIIVDEAITKIPSLNKSLNILNKDINRSIYIIRENERLLVDNLYCISPVNYLRHKFEGVESRAEYYVFDRDYTLKLRSKLLTQKSTKVLPDRIFLSRKNTKHRNFNEDEVFEVLRSMDFEKVAPEEYSFEEQMQLFNNAKLIVGGAGAAFTNLLFCSQRSKVVCICGNVEGPIPPVFTTQAYFNGCQVRFYKSNDSNTTMGTHSNYRIDTDDFKNFIDKFFE